MKRIPVVPVLTALVLATAPALTAQAPSQSTPQTPPASSSSQGRIGQGSTASDNKDAGFVRDAAGGGMKEVELGKIAARQAANADVKAFASRMVTDHTRANDELMALAKKKSITVPSQVPPMHKTDIDRLSKMTGASFDRAYIEGMVADHEKTVALFQTEAKSGADADIKAWAAKTLPALQEHLKMVKELHGKMDPTGR